MRRFRIESPGGIIALLTVLNLLNYLDRYIVAAVVPRIEAAFHLSKAQAGWVMSAFMVGYFLTSPLFGALGDRWRRRELIAAGVAAWSVATFCSGLAPTFLVLLLCRVGVGVGEASYATLSPTIIDDLSAAHAKNRLLAVFYVAIPVGSALGYVVGGALEPRLGWAGALMVAGGPGLAAAAVTLLIVEPARAPRRRLPTLRDAAAPLWASRRYVGTVAGYVAYTFGLGGFAAWAPSYVHGVLGVPLDRADQVFGLITVGTGLAGTAVGGAFGHVFARQRPPAVAVAVGGAGGSADVLGGWLKFSALSSLAGFPLAWACLVQRSPTGFFVLLGAAELCLFASTAPVNAAILGSVPESLRATAMAVSIFAIHAFGDLVSPPLVGFVADRSRLGWGMMLLPGAVLASAILWWRASRPTPDSVDARA
ncbi:MAG TPA: MFS transporter [Myxococcota bacterium]|nr:MFS transporter [Myxococcota bacterium]